MSTTAITMTHHTRAGAEIEVIFPANFEVCYRCDGTGKHVNPSVDGHGISREEFAEDPDFEEAYFRGDYDVTCSECGGNRVVPVIDETHLRKRQRVILAAIREAAREDAADRRTQMAESGQHCYY
jgi:hypothetical protein